MAATEEELCNCFHSNYPEVVQKVGEITFGEEQRNMKDRMKDIEAKFREQNKKDKSKKANKDTEKEIGQLKSELENKLKKQLADLTQAVCALLNSGGGVIRAEVENKDYSSKCHGIGLDIEGAFREGIQHFSEYFDFKQEGSSMLIFVKSWSSKTLTCPRVFSLNTGLHERSSSSAVKMKPADAVHFLRRKKEHPKVGSWCQVGSAPVNLQRLLLQSDVQMERDINDAATVFFGRRRLAFGMILNFTESTTVEFKDFPRDKDNYEFAQSILPRYASAFANTKGGYLFFGVDNHRKVVGCKRNICPSRFVEVVGETVGTLPVFHFCTSGGKVVFECRALPVYDSSEKGEERERGYVFAVRIEPSCGIVFERTPDSWIIEAGVVKRLTCTDWTRLMTEEDPDVSHFAEGFQIELNRAYKPPLSRSVYSNKGFTCMKTLQRTLFPVNPDGIIYKPEELCEEVFLEYPSLKDLMMKKMKKISSLGILIFSRSWAVDVGLQKHTSVACDILLVAADSFPTLYTVTVDKGYSVSSTIPVLEYSRNVACTLKQKLVNEGGYTRKVCVIPNVIELRSNGEIKRDLSWPVTYPRGYLVSKDGLEELLQALVIVLLRFRSFLSDQIGCEFFNLLTIKQYEILTKNLYKSKKLFVYGLPGSGKTVMALQIIGKIRNIFQCDSSEILYICENRALCKTVRKRVGNMCQAVTRTDFLNGDYSQPGKHIVIDEAQSFQSKDGDWYGKAVKLTEADPDKPGVLWIFLDYLQTSHTEDSGLPPPSKQEPQEWLTTGVRNATQVYNVMMHVTEMIASDRPECLQNVVDKVCNNSILNILSPVQVFAILTERVSNMLNSHIRRDSLYDKLKYPPTHICCGETRAVWNLPDFFKNVHICREAVLRHPERTEILYRQLKKLVEDDPPDENATEILDVAEICIAMIEFMHEISCFPKRFQLFLEEFKRFFNDSLRVYDIIDEVDPWLELEEESEEESEISLRTLDIPYEQLNRLINEAQCGHTLQGTFDMCIFKDQDKIVTVIVQKCLEYFEKGYSSKNIAILCSSLEESDRYKGFLGREMSNHTTELGLNVRFTTADVIEGDAIVVDTIHHFSGLERSIVFAVFPTAKSSYLVPHLLVCMVSRANLQCHVLVDRSKGFCYIASAIENRAVQFLHQIVEKGTATAESHDVDCPENALQKMTTGETLRRVKLTGIKMVMISDDLQNTRAGSPFRIMGEPYKVQRVKDNEYRSFRSYRSRIEETEDLYFKEPEDVFFKEPEDFGEAKDLSLEEIEGLDFPVPLFAICQEIERNREMIENYAGVRIRFTPFAGIILDRLPTIVGPPDRCQRAADIITCLVRDSEAGPDNRERGQGNWHARPPGKVQEFSLNVPIGKTGLIIRKYGETSESNSRRSGARIELQSNLAPDADPNMIVVTIQGTAQPVDNAQQLVGGKICGLMYPLRLPEPHGPPDVVPGAPMGTYNPPP